MGDRLRDRGLSVQWNTELVGLEQESGQVTATLKQPDGTSRKITAAGSPAATARAAPCAS